MEKRLGEVMKILPVRFRGELMQQQTLLKKIQEIRIRMGKPVYILTSEEEMVLTFHTTNSNVESSDIREMIEYISGYSMYACEEELRNGFLTLKGGHRVGIAGEVVLEQGNIKTMKNIASFNIRISRQVKGCADRLMSYTGGNMLLISPPRMGKTTLLRDLLRQIGERPGENVGIVDERSEIAACYRGVPTNDLGTRVDILDGCPKAEGMLMLLRSMSPTVIGVDELGKQEDVEAVLRVINCGVRVIATVHGEDLKEIRKKQVFQHLFSEQVFHTYVVLQKEKIEIWNENFEMEERVSRKIRGEDEDR